jgi:hypothetical protein
MLFSIAMTFSRFVGDGIVARFREPLCADTWWGDTASSGCAASFSKKVLQG